jgi:hypothetical protein
MSSPESRFSFLLSGNAETEAKSSSDDVKEYVNLHWGLIRHRNKSFVGMSVTLTAAN